MSGTLTKNAIIPDAEKMNFIREFIDCRNAEMMCMIENR